MSHALTVISWNVDGWHTIRKAQVELIDATGAELALLQEVTPESADVLRPAGWEVITALEHLPTDHVERAGRRPRFSCAVASRCELAIAGAEVLTDAPTPVRTIVARITQPDGDRRADRAARPSRARAGRHGLRRESAARCHTHPVRWESLKRFGIKPSGSPTGNRAIRARCPRRKSWPVRSAHRHERG